MGTNRLTGLDGLRGIAALCVLAYHAAMIETGVVHGNAYLAVDFFFMLSGFVMARAYEHRFAQGMGILAFLRARVVRLWPIMAVGGVLGLPLLAARAGSEFGWIAVLNLLMLPTPVGNAIFPLNGPAWSIFFEIVANFFHVLILWRLSTRLLIIVIIPLIGAMIMVGSHGSIDVGATPATFWLGIPRVLLAYGVGVLVWRLRNFAARLRPSPSFTFGAMPALFVGIAMLGAHSGVFDMLFVLLVCPLLLIGGFRFSGNSSLAQFVGALSFPLYAVHMPILETSDELGLGIGFGMAMSAATAAILAWLPSYFIRRARA